MTQDDLLYRFRLRTFAVAAELGNVGAACRAMGIHPSNFSRWKRQLERHGPEILRPRERRPPRMANQTSVLVSSGWSPSPWATPGSGRPGSRPSWPGPPGAGSACRPMGCGGCCVATACRPGPSGSGWWPATRPHRPRNGRRHRLRGTCRSITQVSWSSWTAWHRPPLRHQGHRVAIHRHRRRQRRHLGDPAGDQTEPSALWTSALARQVASDLAARGWRLERVMSDNAQEFRSSVFQQTVAGLGTHHSFIRG